MSIQQRLVSQFGHPRGPLGWVAGRIMSKRTSNVERTLATIELLDLKVTDRVLEIGHGPGVGLERVLAVVDQGSVVGLERSTAMTSMASRRNRAAVKSGRLTFVTADAQTPPADIGQFDAIFSSNVWQFWSDPIETLRRWRAHLTSDGVMAVTFRPPHPKADEGEALAAGQRIVDQLRQAGYRDVRLETFQIGDVPAVCGIGGAGS
jgi:SAM-dependent methyltransferase